MNRLFGLTLLVACLYWGNSYALALNVSDVPADAFNDSIMARPAEVAEIADWAAAAFGGKTPALALPLLGQPFPPFSFVYGGKSSGELLKTWPHTVRQTVLADRVRRQVAWTIQRRASV